MNHGPRAPAAAALTGGADPGFAGGSYVIVQKYLHDMAAWNALSTEDQEKAIGRLSPAACTSRRPRTSSTPSRILRPRPVRASRTPGHWASAA